MSSTQSLNSMMQGRILQRLTGAFAIWLIFSVSKETLADDEKEGCRVIETEQSFVRTAGNRNQVRLWPSTRIPYELKDFRAQDHEPFKNAVQDYRKHTCIRLEPRTGGDRSYIIVRIMKPGEFWGCGQAHMCYQGKPQDVDISPACNDVQTFVHEIGHALCLEHEHTRVDRDEGHMYDYHSQLHYRCFGCFGSPRMEGVRLGHCGPEANKGGLSVLDADKLNAYYNCKGCHRHRWYRLDTLTNQESVSLVNFAIVPGEGTVYLCRGYVKGEISPGTYIHGERACEIPDDINVHKVTKHIQLFALPNGPKVISNTTTSDYRLLHPSDEGTVRNLVPVGRTKLNVALFAAVRQVEDSHGRRRTVFGRVKSGAEYKATYVHKGSVVSTYQFSDTKIEFYNIGCA